MATHRHGVAVDLIGDALRGRLTAAVVELQGHRADGRKGKERKGKERKGKERKGNEMKGKERKGKEVEVGEGKGREASMSDSGTGCREWKGAEGRRKTSRSQ